MIRIRVAILSLSVSCREEVKIERREPWKKKTYGCSYDEIRRRDSEPPLTQDLSHPAFSKHPLQIMVD